MSESQNESEKQHERLIQIFRCFLAQDQIVLNAIIQFGKSFRLDNRSWFFTLPDLFDFCCHQSSAISNLNYQSFRKLLYQYPTNQVISVDRGLFELKENRGHIDSNIYVLTHQQKTKR